MQGIAQVPAALATHQHRGGVDLRAAQRVLDAHHGLVALLADQPGAQFARAGVQVQAVVGQHRLQLAQERAEPLQALLHAQAVQVGVAAQAGAARGGAELRDRRLRALALGQRRIFGPAAQPLHQLHVVAALLRRVVALVAQVLHAEQAQRMRGLAQARGLPAELRVEGALQLALCVRRGQGVEHFGQALGQRQLGQRPAAAVLAPGLLQALVLLGRDRGTGIAGQVVALQRARQLAHGRGRFGAGAGQLGRAALAAGQGQRGQQQRWDDMQGHKPGRAWRRHTLIRLVPQNVPHLAGRARFRQAAPRALPLPRLRDAIPMSRQDNAWPDRPCRDNAIGAMSAYRTACRPIAQCCGASCNRLQLLLTSANLNSRWYWTGVPVRYLSEIFRALRHACIARRGVALGKPLPTLEARW
ncbi:hypothetical protein [Xanthomonas translucens]|uniref:hypothetical protein n=1 Tax=Xanthomonas campestris pv. translucens TaxID=343 RepID=UPI00271475F8|nr:hypothetical protein [Xanthomonas translucens]WLA15981.1 hypothetical protein MO326_19295 [Xanthomonas translucens]